MHELVCMPQQKSFISIPPIDTQAHLVLGSAAYKDS